MHFLAYYIITYIQWVWNELVLCLYITQTFTELAVSVAQLIELAWPRYLVATGFALAIYIHVALYSHVHPFNFTYNNYILSVFLVVLYKCHEEGCGHGGFESCPNQLQHLFVKHYLHV